ncbi:DUF1446-domain-containing protein [Gigaspora margarita]|uniref:DUF1446-domain-containing protein n=1 Tax=Gigaspora margarita TaxID=4874 RepID=A0A8H4AYR7_GIGMA|nr:DUF1446-domain-containing protein [Gigaspora margarita]
MVSNKPVRIGCYSAFWGDSVSAAEQLVKTEKDALDYLVGDYLSEVTIGLLARSRNQDRKSLKGASKGGYISEFLTYVLRPLLPDIIKYNIKVVTNAGGLDPLACKLAIENLVKELDIEEGKVIVAAVTGDDILDKANDKNSEILNFTHVKEDTEDSESFSFNKKKVISFNAYFGAIPIVKALKSGANIVVTGRCVDSALVLGPLIHEFMWDPHNDWDLLASGSLAGHIIECGCQATGGNFTDWRQSAYSPGGGWYNIGYPIIECFKNGEFFVTKPKDTGGLVTPATVGEQMVYEILDPGAYILPDVILDLRNVKLKQIEENKVLVTGAKGRAPTEYLKVSGIYLDGYKMTGQIIIGGIDAWNKAIAVANTILMKTRVLFRRKALGDYRDVNVEVLGAEHTYGGNAKTRNTREVVLNITVYHDNLDALKFFGMELAPSATSMAPGITGSGAGRPHPSPCLVHFARLISKNSVSPFVIVGNKSAEKIIFDGPTHNDNIIPPPLPEIPNEIDYKIDSEIMTKVPLIRLAWGRSGDKGDVCNIGILAREPKYYPFLKNSLTEEAVKDYMIHLCRGIVKRYELSGCNGLNFVLTRCLGGGGLSSLNVDKQGKTYAQMLLSFEVDVPSSLFAKL